MVKKNILILVGLLFAVLIILSVVSMYILFHDSPEVALGKSFIWDLAAKKESASTYLSSRLMNEVGKRCPNASLVECTRFLIPSSWGNLKEVHFAAGTNGDTFLFSTFWSNDGVWASVVLIIKNENGNWVIDGWRGFVPTQGEDKDGELLHNLRHDNEFP